MNYQQMFILLLLLIQIILLIIIIKYLKTEIKVEQYGIIDDIKKLINEKDIKRLTSKTEEAIDYLKRNPKDAIGSLFKTPENKPLPEVANFIMKYSNYTVVNIDVCKTPVVSTIKLLMNVLSGGELQSRMKEKNIPELFHLFMNITLLNFENGDMVQFRIEKDEVVKINKIRENQVANCLHVNLNKEIKFIDFINNAIKIHPQLCKSPFWIYDSAKANCQIFVQSFIYGNDLDTDELEIFINQNAEKLLEGLGLAKNVSRKITDLYANLKQFIYL
jgi:hypothetical protein